jgi:dephospho-CoA kinase
MLLAGLTGGLATGKSTVGRALSEWGCHLIEADAIGHQLLAPGGMAVAPVVAEFGPGIEKNGGIDRKALGQIVFSDPARLKRLNEIVHPLVFEKEAELLNEWRETDPGGIAVLEAAILIETGSHRRCQRVILTECPEALQIQRAMDRGGLTAEEARLRISRQMPIAEKRQFADYIIGTSGTIEQTLRQTRTVFERLRSISQ